MTTYQSSRQLDALGDPTRRAIFERLRAGPLAVGDIARTLPVSRPAVSQHLKVLKDSKLVTDRAEGTRRVYQLDPAGLAAIRSYFDGFWTDALESFRRTVEEPVTENPRGRRTEPRPNQKEKKQ